MMSMYGAGVSPIEPGYTKFQVVPQIGDLKTINAVIPACIGDITVNINHEDLNNFTVSTTVPGGSTARIGVPLIGGKDATTVTYNNNVIWGNELEEERPQAAELLQPRTDNGTEPKYVGQDENFVYFEATSDTTLTATRGKIKQLNINVDDKENIKLLVNGEEQEMPYQNSKLKTGEEVDIQFVSKYDGEYGLDSLSEANNKVSLDTKDNMEFKINMDDDYSLTGTAKYIGRSNLALGKTVTVNNPRTDISDPEWSANNLVDGLRKSNNESAQPKGYSSKDSTTQDLDTPDEISIDLGSIQEIDTVNLYPQTNTQSDALGYANYPENFTIQVSENGTDWTTVVTKEGEKVGDSGRNEYSFDSIKTQYVKVVTTKAGDASFTTKTAKYNVQFAEMEIYGNGTPDETTGSEVTAKTAADSIIIPEILDQDAISMPAVVVPEGFSAAIVKSDNEKVISLDGTVAPQEEDQVVKIVYNVIGKDGDEYETQELTTTVPAIAPTDVSIVTSPISILRTVDGKADFTVETAGTFPHYQWQVKTADADWTDIKDATLATYEIDALTIEDNGNSYRCAVTNKKTTEPIYSEEANLTVDKSVDTPIFETEPTAGELRYGQTLSECEITGAKLNVPGTLQWKDDTIVPEVGESNQLIIFVPDDQSKYPQIELEVKVTVAKSDVTVNDLKLSTLENGQTLADVIIEAQVINPNSQQEVEGQWSWTSNSDEPIGNGTIEELKFTPTDASNYNSYLTEVEITVNPAKEDGSKDQDNDKGSDIDSGNNQSEGSDGQTPGTKAGSSDEGSDISNGSSTGSITGATIDNSAKSSNSKSDINTGDKNNIIMYLTIALGALILVVVGIVIKRKRRK
ncbi:MAG: discoidin domain-containing protein [Suipraeoptans sp.]